MREDVLQLADNVQRDGGNVISGGLISIGIGHVREGNGYTLGRNELNHSDGSVLITSSLGGNAVGGLELEAVVTEGIGWRIPVVDGPVQRWRSKARTMD